MKVIIVVMDVIIYCKCVTYLFVVDIGSLNLSLTTPSKKSFNLLLGLN